jgi:type IV pilus assembly protein PilB
MSLPDALKLILINSGYITEEQYDSAAQSAADLNQPLADILLFRGLITEEALGKLVAEYYQVPFVSLKNFKIPPEILELIPEKTAVSFRIIPFGMENNQLNIAMVNPHDLEALEFAKRSSNLNVIPHYVNPSDLSRALGQYKQNIQAEFEQIIKENVAQTKTASDKDGQANVDLPVTRILDTLLEYAYAEGASDVHIELLEEEVLVRFRIDGMLRDILALPKEIHPGIVARVKILASLKIDEHRTPQDGRFKFKLEDGFMALRVSILPAFYGENIVMRLLAESARPLSLEELGYSGRSLDIVLNNINKPNGMILVTGPTGSGKTTSLYSLLTILNTTEKKICTIEDPVEYGIRRVNQVQVNNSTGLTFAAGLRSLMRHDPDVIMIGEIRDAETAEIAIHAALTGHLVISTLHTNSAAAAIPRLIDMGVEGFLIASTLKMIIAQRLVREINSKFITKYTPEPEMLEQLENALGEPVKVDAFYRPEGYEESGGSPFKGRVGIYEIMEVNNEIRNLITKGASAKEIEQAAIKNGMTKLLEDGINKAASGHTTIEEALRASRE